MHHAMHLCAPPQYSARAQWVNAKGPTTKDPYRPLPQGNAHSAPKAKAQDQAIVLRKSWNLLGHAPHGPHNLGF
jgi:hypothetical protein